MRKLDYNEKQVLHHNCSLAGLTAANRPVNVFRAKINFKKVIVIMLAGARKLNGRNCRKECMCHRFDRGLFKLALAGTA